jgi:hypothetical protein
METALRRNMVAGFIFVRAAFAQLEPQGRGALLFTGASAYRVLSRLGSSEGVDASRVDLWLEAASSCD